MLYENNYSIHLFVGTYVKKEWNNMSWKNRFIYK